MWCLSGFIIHPSLSHVCDLVFFFFLISINLLSSSDDLEILASTLKKKKYSAHMLTKFEDMLPLGSSWNSKHMPVVSAGSRLTSPKGYVANHSPSPPFPNYLQMLLNIVKWPWTSYMRCIIRLREKKNEDASFHAVPSHLLLFEQHPSEYLRIYDTPFFVSDIIIYKSFGNCKNLRTLDKQHRNLADRK